MADNLSPASTPPAEASTPNTVTNVSGGVNINTPADVSISGDVVGGDKSTTTFKTGGAYVAGDVNATEFVGRDKNVYTVVPRDKSLRILLEKVRTFWVEGVLENSVHHAALIELGKQIRTDAVEVDHPWETVVRTADQPDRTLPPNQKIADAFDEMKGALLILGEPGSGKTTMLLELARDLISRAEKDSTLPVPVVFNLSSWAAKRQTIAKWLVDELKAKYGVPGKMGRQWIENNDLILLLDGLDEVKSERREACVDAINTFRPEHGLTGIVVCSRTREYEELASRLKLNGAVLIQPLSGEQVNHYIAAGGSQLAALGHAIRADVPLQELAEVPLMLSVMSMAYSGWSIDSLTSVSDDLTQRRKHLFNAYVDKMFARTARTKNESYSRGDTVHWLAWLAARMSVHGQSVFLVEGMQPSWLQSKAQRWTFSIGGFVWLFGLLGLLANGLVGALVLGPLGALLGIVSGRASRSNNEWLTIRLTESIEVSRSGLVRGVTMGLVMGLVIAVLFYWGTITGLIGVLFLAVYMGLFVGLRSAQIETKTEPNQGIWLSGKNALLLMLVFVLFGGLLGVLAGDPGSGLRSGLYGGLMFGVLFGGTAFIEHFMLRFILWRNGYIPRDYVRFLDYAADRIFLRKVGGGYIFIHSMLMDYFAALETQPGVQDNEPAV